MSELWATPQALFDKLDEEFAFDLDVCALPQNAKCDSFFTPNDDGLNEASTWFNVCWMNPPYGREIVKWMEKAYLASLAGATVVALIPNRSNAPWWHDYVMKAREIRFIKHKVAFEVPLGLEERYGVGVPFWVSVIVVFGPGARQGELKVSTYLQPKHEVSAPSTDVITGERE